LEHTFIAVLISFALSVGLWFNGL
jgi:hypothetical protein